MLIYFFFFFFFKIVHWDERSVYYRQDIRTLHDGFIRSTAYGKATFIGITPIEVLREAAVGCSQVPSCLASSQNFLEEKNYDLFERFRQIRPAPSDLKTFAEFNELSSLRLKASKVVENATDEAVIKLTEKEVKKEW